MTLTSKVKVVIFFPPVIFPVFVNGDSAFLVIAQAITSGISLDFDSCVLFAYFYIFSSSPLAYPGSPAFNVFLESDYFFLPGCLRSPLTAASASLACSSPRGNL